MSDLNQVTLQGRLTRDPELKFLNSGMAVCSFGLASGKKFKTASGEMKEKTCFVDCTIFGKRAEALNNFFSKGKQILITGELDLQQWEDKNGGGKRSKIGVLVEGFHFVGNKSDGSGGPPEQGRATEDRQHHPADDGGQGASYSEDDIPF